MKPPILRPAFLGMCLGLAPCASAQVQLLAWWDFDNSAGAAIAVDSRSGMGAQIRNGAAATAAGGGRTGAATDRAMFFGTGSQNLYVADASFFNQAASGDAVTVSFWQKLSSITSPFTIFVTSPSSTGGGRGFSGHVPWSNNIVYFDSAGCCDPPQRISDIPLDSNGNPVSWVDTWHHVAFVKNGEVKEVYVDGIPGPTGGGAAPLPTDFTDMYIGNGPGLGNVVNGAIDDVAVFSGALDAAQIAALAGGATPASIVGSPNDSDNDGLPDGYENQFFPGDLTKLTSAGDFDADGLTDGSEFSLGTNPTSNDSDGDGLKDNVENRTGTFVSVTDTGTNPSIADTDGDGLADGVENPLLPFLNASQPGTDPNKADTDADTFSDGLEVLYSSSNPRNPASRPLRSGLLDILAYWSFNNDADPLSTSDSIKGFVGELQNGTVFTPDGGGRTGQAGDKAVDFGASGASDTAVRVATGGFLSLGGAQDEIAFSFWQKLVAVVDSSSFWGEAPSSGGGRGAQGHATWSNNNFYWDTAGCCDGSTQRVNGPSPIGLADTPDWHHIVFQKKGAVKEVWLDGALIVSGNSTAPLPKDFTVLHIGSDNAAANIAGMIDDFAVYADALTPAEIAQLAAGASPTSIVPPSSDTDGDGMDNAYETANGLNPNVDDALGDLDSDGLANIDEYIKNTKPNNPDTDGDTLKDGVETGTGIFVDANNRGTNPLSQDSDGDGLSDGVENPALPFVDKNQPGTNPTKADSDGDTWNDSSEIAFGSNPTLPASVPALNPNGLDLLAYWPFDTATDATKAVDVQHSIEAAVGGGVVYTDAGGGRTSAGTDRALDYGTAQGGQYVRVLGAQWLNLASTQNQVAISFWQNLSQVISSTVVKFTSPSSSGGSRGLSAHTTWGDGNFYFDTAGCCDATQRISGPNDLNFVEEWHHIVIQKNGDLKQIWVDGVVKVEGTNTGPLPSDLTDLFIGTSNGGESMLGRLDDFAIFGDALTETQIAQLAGGASPLSLLGNTPATPLAFTSISYNAATSQITLTWTSQPGKTYRLESSQNLATWPVEINDNIASGGTTTTYVHSLSSFPGGQPAALYYRIKQN